MNRTERSGMPGKLFHKLEAKLSDKNTTHYTPHKLLEQRMLATYSLYLYSCTLAQHGQQTAGISSCSVLLSWN